MTLETPVPISAQLGSLESAVQSTLSALDEHNVAKRIWNIDHTVWQESPTEIENRLGWLKIAEEMKGTLDQLNHFAQKVRDDGLTHVLLLGMGGSSLGPEVLSRTFGADSEGLHLEILDSTDPDAVQAYHDSLDLEKTLFIVATKSGGTAETLSFFKFFYNKLHEKVGDKAGAHFVAITDPGSKLIQIASDNKFRETFLNNPNIGGRYSVLSYFGLVPAVLIGLDVAKLLDSAIQMAQASAAKVSTDQNPGAVLGAIMSTAAKEGRDKLTFLASAGIDSFGDWVEQLIAESTGKNDMGILPVVGEELGDPDQYGDDRVFVHLQLPGDTSDDAKLNALGEAGHPLIHIDWDDKYAMGGNFFLWEFATAVAGHVMGIHPFNQPNVEAAKVAARKAIDQYTESGSLPDASPAPLDGEALLEFLEQFNPGDYIAIHAYVPPTEETSAALNDLRLALRAKTKCATTVGYGPRFLHSTGQLHKGDGGNGMFIQLTSQPDQDLDIPDEAGKTDSAMTFQVLKTAQMLGDHAALQENNRRVIQFDLGQNVVGGLKLLTEVLP
ncbi:MAG: glucose-6-phosphate isomerase [Chloroflexi bacterium]|nr:glucose-6-phosphate isomerase [Chloroflexota bacterium]